MDWKEEKVGIHFGSNYDVNVRTEAAGDAVALINQGMLFSPEAFRVSAGGSPGTGLFVTVTLGEPYNHHCMQPSLRLEYPRWDTQDICWSRSNPSVDDFWFSKLIEEFKILFEIIFESNINKIPTIVIENLREDVAAGALLEIMKDRPNRITRMEVLNNDDDEHQNRAVDFCCQILPKMKDIKTFCFERITEVNDYVILHLFETMNAMKNLETIDFRVNRFMTSTYKNKGITQGNDDQIGLSITPLVGALVSSKTSIVKNLYFGGRKLSSDSVVDLANAMPHLRLRKLSLRACGLDEIALIAIVQALAQNTELRELDLSHNTFTTNVMEELCLALKLNKFLEKLVVEHCDIDLPQVQCLAEALPGIKNLRYLWMDGNTFTWTPTIILRDVTAEEIASTRRYFLVPVGNAHTPYSIGANTLARAMPYNTRLLEVKMGEFRELAGFSRVCCTPPPYTEHIWRALRAECKGALMRNLEHYQETRWTKMQKAVITIAAILLAKIDAEDQASE